MNTNHSDHTVGPQVGCGFFKNRPEVQPLYGLANAGSEESTMFQKTLCFAVAILVLGASFFPTVVKAQSSGRVITESTCLNAM